MDGPVFVFGSVRTASSLLVAALKSIGYAGENEGHLFHLFRRLDDDIHRYYEVFEKYAVPGTTLHRVPESAARTWFEDSVRGLTAGLYGGDRWVEKTVNLESLSSVGVYRRLWPGSRIIFSRRRPIENIQSRLAKFPQHDFRYHVVNLVQIYGSWLKIRRSLEGWIELDQYEIATDPGAAAGAIARLLTLSETERGAVADFMANRHPQRTASSYVPLSLDDLDWTEEMKRFFRRKTAAVNEAFGYSNDADYWADPPASTATTPASQSA
jgi:hypothetical protein